MSNGTYGFRFLQVYLILKIMPLTEMQNFFPCLLHFLLIPVDPLNHILNVTFEAQYHVQSLKTEKMIFFTFFTVLPSAKTWAFCKNQQIDVSSFTLRDSKLLHSLSYKNK